MSKNDGGKAFPRVGIARSRDSMPHLEAHEGMSLRDYFAAAALKGLASVPAPNLPTADIVLADAETAYLYADAMLAEREK